MFGLLEPRVSKQRDIHRQHKQFSLQCTILWHQPMYTLHHLLSFFFLPDLIQNVCLIFNLQTNAILSSLSYLHSQATPEREMAQFS
jgi:hypothetical protein